MGGTGGEFPLGGGKGFGGGGVAEISIEGFYQGNGAGIGHPPEGGHDAAGAGEEERLSQGDEVIAAGEGAHLSQRGFAAGEIDERGADVEAKHFVDFEAPIPLWCGARRGPQVHPREEWIVGIQHTVGREVEDPSIPS